MICVTVLYANTPGERFNHDYYVQTHMPLCFERLKTHGMIRYEVDRGLFGRDPAAEAPYVCMGRLYFTTLEDFQSGMSAHGPEIVADIPNYTNIAPALQVSETS